MTTPSSIPSTRSFHVLLPDAFADWEPAFALCELARQGGWQVTTLGVDAKPVRSMGGLTVTPDHALAEVDPTSVQALLVVGSPVWEQGEQPAVSRFLRAVAETGATIAAICGATIAAAHAGLLAGRRYTSNAADYVVEAVEQPLGTYVNAAAVRDDRLITAGGFGHIELAGELLVAIGALPADAKPGWVAWLRTGIAPTDPS